MPVHCNYHPASPDLAFVADRHAQVLVIQGYVGVFDLPLPAPPSHGSPIIGTLAVVSRLGSKRAGTRFNTRGVDDDGNTANFVEVHKFEFCLSLLDLTKNSFRVAIDRQRPSLVHMNTRSVMHKFEAVFHVSEYLLRP